MYDVRAQYEGNASVEQIWHVAEEGSLRALCAANLSESAEVHSVVDPFTVTGRLCYLCKGRLDQQQAAQA
jgi:hypothetical protein